MNHAIKLIIILTFIAKIAFGLEDTDFGKSSGLDLNPDIQSPQFQGSLKQSEFKFELIRNNYERLKPSKTHLADKPIIPLIIHLIWLGEDKLPKNYQYYLYTWQQYHPNWQIKLWTEQDILKENFSSIDLYWLAQSYQERSGLIRYEILYKYGGLYIDSDIECFSNFNDLNHKYDFYANLEAPIYGTLTITNAMIGSIPKHPIIEQTLDILRKNWFKNKTIFEQNFSNGPYEFKRSKHALAIPRTMYPFGYAIHNFLLSTDQTNYKSIILPAGYGFPLYKVTTHGNIEHKNIIRPETMSFHHFFKVNSLVNQIDFSNSLFKSGIKGFITKFLLKYNNDKYFLNFKSLFNSNFPTNIPYETIAKIPTIIYLHNDNNIQGTELLSLKEKWQKLNPFFTIKIIQDNELEQFLPKSLNSLDKQITKALLPFYLLNKEGGVYVKANFKPAKLQEFNYKYSYYGLFQQPSDLDPNLKLDNSFMAIRANHCIISLS